MSGAAQTIGALLDARAGELLGRERELTALRPILADDGPLVMAVHGLAGCGKSALLHALATEARAAGAAVVRLDAATFEPTARGFLAALGEATGTAGVADAPAAGRALGALGPRVVLLLDGYESLRLLDTGLRQVLVPALPAHARVVVAGREPLLAGWAVAYGDSFRQLAVGNLERREAEQLLRRAGVDAARAAAVNQVARGHPLTLRLAASMLAARPDLDLRAVTEEALVRELAAAHLAGLDPAARRALDAASVVRRPTIALLAAMLPEQPADESFARLAAQPFVARAPDGLVVHETVRAALAALLRASDPERHRAYRAAAWRHLRRELEAASPRDLWRTTADLLFLLEHPLMREGFFPAADRSHAVEPARPDDREAIMALVHRHEGALSAEIAAAWWSATPEAFRVARGPAGAAEGLLLVAETGTIRAALWDTDPVARRVREHLRASPLPRDATALLCRALLTLEAGEHSSPPQAACWIDIKRLYLLLRPRLRRVYAAIRDVDRLWPAYEHLGFVPLPGGPLVLDGLRYHPVVLDMGPGSVDGWLARLVAAELHVEEEPGLLDVARRQLVIDGRREDLTRLEFDLLHYLMAREGRPVERAELLRDVWGYDWTGGSNVIEAVVSSLRRKLGDRADAVETVRGVGYRYRH